MGLEGGGGAVRDYNDYSCFCGRNKKPTGCYTGLAFMKKDIDVNDCEFPPSYSKKKKKKKKKIETSYELSKWQKQAPSVHAEQPALIHFYNERRKREKKEKGFC